jgi:hypothetical protein
MLKIAATLSVASFMLLACPLPGQSAPLMPSPLVAKSSTENANKVEVRYRWGRWHGVLNIEGYSPSEYAYDLDAASNANGLYPYPRYYAGHYNPYWHRDYTPYHYGW